MKSLFSTAYWPNLHYFYYLLHSDESVIEQFENYQKQSYRNRTEILSANGMLSLTIPVRKQAPKELIKDLEISYAENWQIRHWRAILSAYKNSPYFEHFEMEISFFYEQRFDSLLEFNQQQLQMILKLLKQKKSISLSARYETSPLECLDLRTSIHPKSDFGKDEQVSKHLLQPYYQTFSDKFEFVPNLSILDLLFNTGLSALDYLQ